MKFGSVCSGIEAASVAWHPLGWKAAWLSEIEPFPSAVLAHHYPNVPNLGDMTTLPERIRLGEVEAPDLFCGGTPCQAFSVAGLRNSLNDARGNLSLIFCEIANAIDKRRLDAGLVPSIVFWEQVPGVFSTKDNAFGCFLGALAGEDEPIIPSGGKWTNAGCVYGPQRAVAWRVLDAQYLGVAQRRRRVFVVASARDDFDPAAVLFEFDGVRRDTAPSREAGQRVAPSIAGCSNGGGANGPGRDVDSVESLQVITMAHGQGGAEIATDRAPTLTCNHEAPIAFQQTADCLTAAYGTKWNGNASATNGSLFAAQPMPINTMVALRHEALGEGTGFGIGEAGDPAYTLTKGHSHAVATVAAFKGGQGSSAGGIGYDEYVSPTLSAADSGSNRTPALLQAMQVRRLTPVECERLQGFPDHYTAIPWRGKPVDNCPDGPRYKALGNSWAVPVVRWIGRRIHGALN